MELHIGETFSIDPGYLVTERSAVIGQSGSGKSYLVSVICEELAASDLGFVVIDTEGEYAGLSGHKNIAVIEDIEPISTDEERVRKIIEESQKIVLDVSETDPKAINTFLESVYRVATEMFRQGRHRQNPFLVIVEEADIYIPQRGRGLDILQQISRRGRKRGLGVLFATQRPALVNKNVLSQCNNVFIGKLTLKNDIDSVRIFFSSMDDARQLTALEPGQFYVQGAIADPSFIKVRQRKTPHGGATPTIPQRTADALVPSPHGGVHAARDLDKAEHMRARLALDTTTGSKKVYYIPFDETKVLSALNSNKRKHFKFFGRSESVNDFKLLMLPMFSVYVREMKKRLIGTKFNDYTVLIDAITGDILSPDGVRRRSKNLRLLADLNPTQLKVMDFILDRGGTTYAKLREALPDKGVKSSLKKLEELRLIGIKGELYFSLYDISYPKSLVSESSEGLKLSEGRAENVIKPRLSKQQLKGLIRGLYPGCEVTDANTIYSPVLEVLYADESSKRRVRINALTGKILHGA
jgi:ABC-type oligopeptide transport system ATPase subunit